MKVPVPTHMNLWEREVIRAEAQADEMELNELILQKNKKKCIKSYLSL